MRLTLQDVLAYVEGRGLTPIEIDGIPDGFAYKYPDVTIGGVTHEGLLIAYIPLSEFKMVSATTQQQLLELYNNEHVENNLKRPRSTFKG